MSVQLQHQSESYECGHCHEEFTPPATAGSFCSKECHDAHRAEKQAAEVFELLEHDHRFCSTCGRQLKTVEEPPEHNDVGKTIPDCVIGWEYRTNHAELGERSPRVQDDPADPDIPAQGKAPVYAYDRDDETQNTGTYLNYRNPLPTSPSTNDPVRTGTVCSCGNTDHKHEDETLRKRLPFTTAHYLAVATETLRSEDKHEVRIDHERLFESVFERDSIREAFAKAVIL
ncbi:hypothetical protein [Halostagnicola sp. A-GB9-2]|uniref:hypothetical protein n=1 Tax=Halostagnicola sp. A-GB9-2 TaxID=3048066 RepID=UPI0024BF1368|nr:hypothetical protein [Halostagnicola sp. A-GB9-2]MDJ1433605.1 hypothetical protein [Halostagnicola sp. A-GB9-2]